MNKTMLRTSKRISINFRRSKKVFPLAVPFELRSEEFIKQWQ